MKIAITGGTGFVGRNIAHGAVIGGVGSPNSLKFAAARQPASMARQGSRRDGRRRRNSTDVAWIEASRSGLASSLEILVS